MNRRSFIQNSAMVVGALTLSQQKLLAGFFDDPWKITMLRNDVGIFTERGGTIAFLLSKKGDRGRGFTISRPKQAPD